jgi:hypothetical protein
MCIKVDMASAARCPAPLTVIVGIVIVSSFIWLVHYQNSYRSALQEAFADSGLNPSVSMEQVMNPKVTKDEANECFRKTLVYLENNPGDASPFLDFVKNSFFTQAALFKSPMSFNGLSAKWDRGFGLPGAVSLK